MVTQTKETKCVYLSAKRFRWHGKKEFKCHIHSSFSHDIDKQIWILLFAFRFRLTLKNGLELRISFFAFASLWKTDTNFSFRFSFWHHFEKRIWISFLVFASLWKTDLNFVCMTWKRIIAPVQSFEAPATPSGMTGAFTFYVCESKWIFLSPGPKWVVNSSPSQWYVLHTQGTPFFNNGWQMIWW